ncbi:class I SAM-dependent methyltransferase [Pseudomonadota bacterium]
MAPDNAVKNYGWKNTGKAQSHNYITPVVIAFIKKEMPKRILDLGCGNGNLCNTISKEFNAHVAGIDYDPNGIALAKKSFTSIPFYNYGVQDNPDHLMKDEKDFFDVVISTEVIEHLYSPQLLPQYAHKVLKPGGKLFITTPYHGYLKNLALSLLDHWDTHHTPLWEGGHIKFWSYKTLSELLEKNGFKVIKHSGIGRAPYFWKSMVIICQKL